MHAFSDPNGLRETWAADDVQLGDADVCTCSDLNTVCNASKRRSGLSAHRQVLQVLKHECLGPLTRSYLDDISSRSFVYGRLDGGMSVRRDLKDGGVCDGEQEQWVHGKTLLEGSKQLPCRLQF
jgi:hypothetical protein